MEKPMAGDMSYQRNTIDRSRYADVLDRGVRMYEEQLNFKVNELEGKRVLNLGAGERLTFERETQEAGIDCDIVSLSIDFADEKHRKKLFKNGKDESEGYVVPGAQPIAGLAQQLPFANESFDWILSNHLGRAFGI